MKVYLTIARMNQELAVFIGHLLYDDVPTESLRHPDTSFSPLTSRALLHRLYPTIQSKIRELNSDYVHRCQIIQKDAQEQLRASEQKLQTNLDMHERKLQQLKIAGEKEREKLQMAIREHELLTSKFPKH